MSNVIVIEIIILESKQNFGMFKQNIHRKFHPDKQQQLPVTNLGHEPYSYQIRPRSIGHEPVTAPKKGHEPH